jgi:hypothetical protein
MTRVRGDLDTLRSELAAARAAVEAAEAEQRSAVASAEVACASPAFASLAAFNDILICYLLCITLNRRIVPILNGGCPLPTGIGVLCAP